MRKNSPGNPSSFNVDDPVILGTTPEFKQTDNVDNKCNDNAQGVNAITMVTGPNTQQNLWAGNEVNAIMMDDSITPITDGLKVNSNLNTTEGNVPEPDPSISPNVIGPTLSKPKTTWIRINMMDFGLSWLSRALTLPTLGKSDSPQESDVWPK